MKGEWKDIGGQIGYGSHINFPPAMQEETISTYNLERITNR